ncbi:MAG: hypothetical protein R2697_14120 [Ilumatobacteraceae bacterium]
MRQDRGEHDVGPITGGDEHGVVLDVVEHVGHRHRRHLDVAHAPGEVVRIATDEFGAESTLELCERRLAQFGQFRDRPHGIVAVELGEPVAQRIEDRSADPVDDHGADRVVAERLAADADPVEDLVDIAVVPVDDHDDRGTEVFRHPQVDVEFDGEDAPVKSVPSTTTKSLCASIRL